MYSGALLPARTDTTTFSNRSAKSQGPYGPKRPPRASLWLFMFSHMHVLEPTAPNPLHCVLIVTFQGLQAFFRVFCGRIRFGALNCLVTRTSLLLIYTCLSRKIVDENAARYITIRLIEAVQYLHSKGFYHGNIHPNNIYINDKGQSVLVI
ncbi:hypothetical protein CHS0354_006039 [Potamilus streckersoni]|uniref:Protein kinase domain-containing protein n=1 Tax=Potamilus streckersoni TaxID=2493646 RepID=A0AAE0VPQ6_9BIVA|nr:hypothetical protein CHS0354_006039 [Potamilus streckersoni]